MPQRQNNDLTYWIPVHVKIEKYLRRKPGMLFTTQELVVGAKIGANFIYNHNFNVKILPFRQKVKGRFFWGTKETIQQLKKQLRHENR